MRSSHCMLAWRCASHANLNIAKDLVPKGQLLHHVRAAAGSSGAAAMRESCAAVHAAAAADARAAATTRPSCLHAPSSFVDSRLADTTEAAAATGEASHHGGGRPRLMTMQQQQQHHYHHHHPWWLSSSSFAAAPYTARAHSACSLQHKRTFFASLTDGGAHGGSGRAYRERKLLGWAPDQLYDVVARVEDYHQFVPWCVQSTVLTARPDGGYLEAELKVGFQALSERYTSQVTLERPSRVHSSVRDSRLFGHLESTWALRPGPMPGTTWLAFSVDFAFRSALHAHIADAFFSEVATRMVGAFEARCAALYGPSALGAGASGGGGARKGATAAAAAATARVAGPTQQQPQQQHESRWQHVQQQQPPPPPSAPLQGSGDAFVATKRPEPASQPAAALEHAQADINK